MEVRLFIRWVGIAALSLSSSSAWGQVVSPGETIGLYTAVQGAVQATHPVQPGEPPQTAVPVIPRDDVLFRDLIETQEASRMKALFTDDTLFTVGANSRVEITEYIFDPDQGRRSTVIELIKGRVRALVGKLFVEMGSKFEIHTPTAVAAARGTYFVVWIEDNPGTGVANIGQTGTVDFTSQGQTVTVQPGQFTVAAIGLPPINPVAITSAAPKAVGDAIQGTDMEDSAAPETSLEVATKSGGEPSPEPTLGLVTTPVVIGPIIVPDPAEVPFEVSSETASVSAKINFGPGFTCQ